MKNRLFSQVEMLRQELCKMSDMIFDNPELDSKEYKSCELLAEYLKEKGFSVKTGVGGKPTSFRAEYSHGEGNPSIGLLCEYDALEGMGHSCGHHMQGAAVCGAAVALKEMAANLPFRIVVYGTPAEEVSGGKIVMLQNGCFHDIDIALMFHGYSGTFTDNKGLSSINFTVTFHGTAAHAAVNPEQGRSALDALLLTFHGVELLREHVLEDTRMHYTVLDSGGPSNVVPARASGDFSLRSYNGAYLETVIARFRNIVKGAAMMTDTTYEIDAGLPYKGKIPVEALDKILMENAKLAGARHIMPPRDKTGSTDFGNVLFEVPGSCIGIAFAPVGSSVHSQAFLDAGKSDQAHDAVVTAAKTLAGTAIDIIENHELLEAIRLEFECKKKDMRSAV